MFADGQAGALGRGAAVHAAADVDVDEEEVVVETIPPAAVVVVLALPVVVGADVVPTRMATPTVGFAVGVGVPACR